MKKRMDNDVATEAVTERPGGGAGGIHLGNYLIGKRGPPPSLP